MDFAFIDNGYVYHTAYDTGDRVPDGSITQAGDNLLALVVKLVGKESLDKAKSSGLVYFDMFGLWMVSYPSWVGTVLNITMLLIILGMISVDIKIPKNSPRTSWCCCNYGKDLAKIAFYIRVSLV